MGKKTLVFEKASENTPAELELLKHISGQVGALLDIIKALFKEDAMEVSLILRSRVHADGIHGAAFLEPDVDIEKVCLILRRMGDIGAQVSANKVDEIPSGVSVLATKDSSEIN